MRSAYLSLLELSFRPDLIEQKGPPDRTFIYAGKLLPNDNPYTNMYGWRGNNEFDRDASRTRFLRDWAEPLQRMAPTAPFRFALATDFDLGSYDPALGGFPAPPRPELDFHVDGQLVRLSGDVGWPDKVLPADEATARQIVAALNPSNGGRRVRLVLTLSANQLDRENRTIIVQPIRLALWDGGTTRVLNQFPLSTSYDQNSQNDAIAKLAHPMPGMRALTTDYVDGAPAFKDSKDLAALFMLVHAKDAVLSVDNYQTRALADTWLSQQARRELVGIGEWAGRDEFARSRSFDAFRTRYLPTLVQAAPALPFRFAFQTNSGFGRYDSGRHGFVVDQLATFGEGLAYTLGTSGTKAIFLSALPDGFWPIEPAAAERALQQLGGNHIVTIVGQFDASEGNGATDGAVTLKLTSLGLYTGDLKTKLYSFPLKTDRVAGIESTAAALRFEQPSPFDTLFQCAKGFQASGGHPPTQFATECWRVVSGRDSRLYDQRGALDQLKPGDAGWPFFPRMGAPEQQAATEAFARWMLAYAAGIDTVGAQFERLAGSSEWEQGTFRAFDPLGNGGETPITQAVGGNLQSDQLIAVERNSVLGALPNRASLYTLSASPALSQNVRGQSTRVRSIVRTGPAKFITPASGQPFLLVELQPISGTLAVGDKQLASTTYDDVPRLGAGFRAPEKPVTRTSAPLLMDGGLLDLIVAGAIGDKLPAETVAHMVERRWLHENGQNLGFGSGFTNKFASAGAVSDPVKFFAIGKRRPSGAEASELGQAFLDWAKVQAPTLPVTVVTPGKVAVKNGAQAMSWSGLACFGSSSFAPENADKLVAECTDQKAQAIATGNRWWTPEKGRECNQRQAARLVQDWVQPVTPGCRPQSGMNDGLDYQDPMKIFVRIPHDLPTPRVGFVGPIRDMLLDATLEITSVSTAAEQPSGVDLLPQPMRQPMQRNSDRTDVNVVVDAAFGGAVWRDTDRREIARVPKTEGKTLANIVTAFGQSTDTDQPDATRPRAKPDFDLLGIRLGMPFAEAEELVRANMKVGRTLDGARIFDPGAKLGAIEPLTSGKLFISPDGREVMALFDEPPTAAGRVMAIWRRLYVDPGVATADAILDGLQRKYGSLPVQQQFGANHALVWGAPDQTCINYFSSGDRRELLQTWHDDGAGDPGFPTFGVMPGVTRSSWGPYWPSNMLRPTEQQGRPTPACGPILRVEVDEARTVRLRTHYVEEIMTDMGGYLAAFEASQKALRSSSDANAGRAPPIKF